MAARQSRRARTYLVEADWTMPELSSADVAELGADTATCRFSHMYFDTSDHALLDQGITLRRRTDEDGHRWQLTLPDGAAPVEFSANGSTSARAVPAELRALLMGVRAGRRVQPVAKIDTDRRRFQLSDHEGNVLAEITDDRVCTTQLGSAAIITTWREVELQPGLGDRQLLRHIHKELLAAGAEPASSGIPKLARALEDANGATDTHREPRTIADATHNYLDAQYRVIVAGDLALRRGDGPVHAIRVAIRRYRSVLHVLADVFDSERAAALNTELAWYASQLGEIRDREVLRAHLDGAVHDLPPELVVGPVAARIDQHLLAEQLKATTRLGTVLRAKRYVALMAELYAWYEQPPFTAAADRRSAKIEKYLRGAQRKLGTRLSAARDNHSDDELIHRARKAGKRARYIAELAEPVLGKSASRYAKQATRMQDALGAHQDSVVARDVLRRLGTATARSGGENGFTFGLLYAQELARADDSRRRAEAQIKRL